MRHIDKSQIKPCPITEEEKKLRNRLGEIDKQLEELKACQEADEQIADLQSIRLEVTKELETLNAKRISLKSQVVRQVHRKPNGVASTARNAVMSPVLDRSQRMKALSSPLGKAAANKTGFKLHNQKKVS